MFKSEIFKPKAGGKMFSNIYGPSEENKKGGSMAVNKPSEFRFEKDFVAKDPLSRVDSAIEMMEIMQELTAHKHNH